LRLHRQLFVGPDCAQEHLGVTEGGLHGGHWVGLIHVETGEFVGDRRRIRLECADVALDERSQVFSDVRD